MKPPSAYRPILIVEDDPHDAALAIDALQEARLANPIIHVVDGREALDYLLRRGDHQDRPAGNPAVVLLDLHMPRLDGLELLRLVRAEPILQGLPVVVLTSSRQDTDLVAG